MKYAFSAALLLLSAAGAILVQAQSKDLSFEVASVKLHDPPTPPFAQIKFGRDSLTLTEIDLSVGLTPAYGVRNYQIQGPDWLHFGGKFFDVVAKGGPKLHASAPETEIDSQWIGDNMLQAPGPTGQVFTNTPMPALAMAVSASLGNDAGPVVDMTGLRGRYDFVLRVVPRPRADDPPQTSDDRLALNKAIVEDDLGLTLQRRKAPVEMFVVDHADKVPTEN